MKAQKKIKHYGEIVFDNYLSRWVVSETSPHVSVRFKDVFRNVGTKVRPPFMLKSTKEIDADLRWFMERYPFRMSDNDRSRLERSADSYYEMLQQTEMFYSSEYKPSNLNLKEGMALAEYQGQARDLFWSVKDLLLADEVGLGKTPTAIASLLNPDFLPAIVVVQPHLAKQWKDEVAKFSDLKAHIVPKGHPGTLPQADVYIAKYSTLHKWVDYLSVVGAKTLILDEVQEIRRLESKKHEACVELHKITENHLALSGSPIYNYGSEVWNIYRAIKPSVFPDYNEFQRAWCAGGGRVSEPEVLGSYLMETRSYIRRTKADVKSQIPPVNKIVHTVGYNEAAIKEMEDRAKVLARGVLQGEFIQRGMASRELSIMVRKATGISKAKDVAEYVKIILDNNEPVVLCAWHRDVYDIWRKEFQDYNPLFYTGNESPAQKEQAKKDFIEGKSKLFILSLRSGVGLDGLQNVCSYIVFGELDWSSAIHSQCIGRLYRYGQEKQVTAIFLVSDSGSDPLVVDINGIKKAQFEGIFNPNNTSQNLEVHDDTIIKEYAKKLLGLK